MAFQLCGPLRYRVLSVIDLLVATGLVTVATMVGRQPVAGRSWQFAVANEFSRRHARRAMDQATLAEARALFDSIVFDSPVTQPVQMAESHADGLRGNWFVPTNADASRTVLYFHGGGYAFYAAAHRDLIRHVAVATRARTFALDYRLAPEHRYPAQLDDASAAYVALLQAGHQPSQLVLAGDSAGGHLMLSLLKKLRDLDLPLPALGIGLCPWTAVGDRSAGVFRNDHCDWVTGNATLQFAEWAFGAECDPEDPRVSPVAYDIAGFPPLYLQAGGREALADMIHRFARHVVPSHGTVTLDVWPDMTHDFQAYGDLLAESAEALGRIGLAVDHYLGASRHEPLARSARTVL